MLLKNKKIWLSLLILACLWASFLPVSATATATSASQPKCDSSTPICLTTPETLNLYLEFQQAAIALMAGDPFQSVTEQIDIGEWGLLTNKILSLTESNFTSPLPKSLIQQLETASLRVVTSSLTSLALFNMSAVTTLADGLMSFTILLQERPIVRDRNKLLDIEWKISQQVFLLGQNSKISQKIKDTAPLLALIKKYKDLGLFSEDSKIDEQMRYPEVFLLLMSLNAQLKNFMTTASTYSLQNPETSIKLHPDWIEKLTEDYRCARFTLGFSCNTSRKSFTAHNKILLGNTLKTTKSAGQTIQQAIAKLKASLKGISKFKKEESLTSDEIDLLRNVYGLDTTKLTKEELESLIPLTFSQQSKNMRNDAKTRGSDAISTLTGRVKSISNYFETAKENYSNKVQLSQTTTQTTSSKQQQKADLNKRKEQITLYKVNYENNTDFYEEMYLQLQTVIQAESKIKLEVELGNNILLTNKFGELTYQVQQIAQKIGNKQTGMRSYLDHICTYQCSNKNSSTCYIP